MVRRRVRGDGTVLWMAWIYFLLPVIVVLFPALGMFRDGFRAIRRDASLRRAQVQARLQLRPFVRIDPLAAPGMLFDLVPESVLEGLDLLKAARWAEGVLLEQPGELPPGWSYNVSGLAALEIHGKVAADLLLDLSRSRLHPPARTKAPDSTLSLGLQLDSEKRRLLTVQFIPGGGRGLAGTLVCSAPSKPLGIDARAGRLRVRLERRGARVEVSVVIDGGRPRVLCAVENTQPLRPIRQIDAGAFLWRPPGYPAGKAYRPKARDAYAAAFSLTCLDPAGCKARSR